MNPRNNPFAPGAGAPPPELAGRKELIQKAAIALHRIRNGKPERSYILYGLRGVGKTVLLNTILRNAEAEGIFTAKIEAPEGRSLPAILAPTLRALLIRLDRVEAAKKGAKRALMALAGFVKLKMTYADIEVAIEVEGEQGLADSGDLDSDLGDLLIAVGEAAAERGTAVVIFIDEIQYLATNQLASLISALHRVAQAQLPLTMVAAGLPQLLGQMGRAKSYAERLFRYEPIDRLNDEEIGDAIRLPIEREGQAVTDEALDGIARATHGYPYFLQEWGKHSWDIAEQSPISLADVEQASVSALAELDASFFRVRFDRLTPKEKQYMQAMAIIGPGPHRSGDIAEQMNKHVNQLAPVRNSLIKKGMIFSPAHGDTAFTVPLFDQFMRRTMS